MRAPGGRNGRGNDLLAPRALIAASVRCDDHACHPLAACARYPVRSLTWLKGTSTVRTTRLAESVPQQ
jgi:hypothetical protein